MLAVNTWKLKLKKKTEPFRIASGNEIFKDKFKNICKTCPLNIKHCR